MKRNGHAPELIKISNGDEGHLSKGQSFVWVARFYQDYFTVWVFKVFSVIHPVSADDNSSTFPRTKHLLAAFSFCEKGVSIWVIRRIDSDWEKRRILTADRVPAAFLYALILLGISSSVEPATVAEEATNEWEANRNSYRNNKSNDKQSIIKS